ncbi:MAG: hypothetical protein J5545_12105 [Bacteroidaceae bacterium]|nr:hypothetical protein [Bacteroidaceae bacterium]
MKKRNTILTVMVACFLSACCGLLFSACEKSESEVRSQLIGTWTHETDNFKDVLVLTEDEKFSFTCHILRYNGKGNYRYEHKGNGQIVSWLILDYDQKEAAKLEVQNISGSELDMVDRYGNSFKFRK